MYMKRIWPAILIAVAAGILVVPIWVVDMPAMPDLPAHLASFFLLDGGISKAPLAHFYRVDWQFVPNLAAEIVVPLLAPVLGLMPATKLFLSAAVGLWVLGAACIQRALFGRIGPAPLLAAFFAYNVNFFWGFLNYEFAAGLALVVFAGWIATANVPRVRRVVLFAAAVLVVYFCHIFAAAILLLLIGTFEFERLIRERSLLSRRTGLLVMDMMLLSAPAVAAFLFLKPQAAGGGDIAFNLLSTWQDRLGAAFEIRYDQPGYVVLAVLGLFCIVGLWRGWLGIHPAMRSVLIALILCVVFMPEWAMGGWGVDLRMPALLGAMTFAAMEMHIRVCRQAVLAAVATVALCVSAAAAGGNWAYYDHQYAEFRAALRNSPRGTRIMTALDGDAMGMASDEPYWHMAEFAIIDRYGFSPLLFTTAGQHVVRLQPQYQSIAAATAQQGSPPDVGELGDLAAGQVDGDEDIADVFPYLMLFQCHYDEVVVIRSGGKPSPVPDILKLRHRGSFFDLYDVRRDDACSNA